MKTIPLLILILILAGNFCHSAELKCANCHTCPAPSKEKPCLKPCPRDMNMAYQVTGPDMVIMDELSQLYVPVVFSHKLHAEMSAFSDGCALCHHHESIIEGKVKPCQDCHEADPRKSDLRKPGLKGAYHRQCLGCHREWSHTTKCSVCHALKSSGATAATVTPDKTDIMGKSHPQIEEPDKLIYETLYDEGEVVTFYHDEHVHRFGFNCADCHQQESCGTCHDLEKDKLEAQLAAHQTPEEPTESIDPHAKCEQCHTMETCSDCHNQEPKPPFNHQKRTGWTLKAYHQKISCTACHGDERKFTTISNNCQSCHKNWTLETFDHAVSGLVLDENHIEMDCENCHIENNFAKKPTCDNCHDDITYPDSKPGS
jgi:hypothetical protein